jgi:hypothetical protein
MKDKRMLCSLLLFVLLLALAPTAVASTTWYVNGVLGSNSNNCMSSQTACRTIGHAISLAASGDTIRVASAIYPEHLTISINLKVIGSGATTTFVDNGPTCCFAVFYISSATANVSLSKLTMRYGFWGVLNAGTVTISDSTISANSGLGNGGGIFNDTAATVRINNSTISQNAADADCLFVTRMCAGGSGGGIYNLGTVTITNSTIAENSAKGGNGGGISGGRLRLNNSTISQNGASEVCAFGHCYGGNGGGIYGSATLQNSIIANSIHGGNCYGTMTSHGYNMSSDGTCNFSNSGDRNYTNPMLGPLQYNGGPTQTMALPSGSPAIDTGNPSGCTDGQGDLLKTDQRGMPRPDHEDSGRCDRGAYERQTD